jgi:hypothetical protein
LRTAETPRAGEPDFSISDGESLAVMLRALELVDHCHGIIFERDFAGAFLVEEEMVLAQAKLSGALAGRDL